MKIQQLLKMEPPIYDGKTHPKEYIKKMRAYCNFRQITDEQEILKFAIMMIDSAISITPENITSFDTLINSLRGDVTFTVFKNTCKRKLQALRYVTENEGGDTAEFISNFHTLCRDAEIVDIEEQKKYLINSLPYDDDYFTKELTKRQKNVNSMNKLIEVFEEIVSEYSRTIRNKYIVALRHVGTGKYLSSCSKNYPVNVSFYLLIILSDFKLLKFYLFY